MKRRHVLTALILVGVLTGLWWLDRAERVRDMERLRHELRHEFRQEWQVQSASERTQAVLSLIELRERNGHPDQGRQEFDTDLRLAHRYLSQAKKKKTKFGMLHLMELTTEYRRRVTPPPVDATPSP